MTKNNLRALLLGAFVCSGMAALVYEITWIRPLQFLLGSTVYTISIIFAAFMLGLGVGSWVMSQVLEKIQNLPKTYALLELGIGLYGVLLLSLFSFLPAAYSKLYFLNQNFYLFETVQFLLVFILLLIPTTFMGATFPVVVRYYTEKKIGKSIGEVYGANNLGAVLGSFASGFILIPLFGIKASIIFAGMLNLLAAGIILFKADRAFFKRLLPFVLGVFFVLAFVGDYNIKQLYSGSFSGVSLPREVAQNVEFLYYEEGLHGTVSVVSDPAGAVSLLINGKGQGGVSIKDLRVDYLLSYLPVLLNPAADNALVVGLGTGATAGHLAGLVKTTTVEIEPKVVEATDYFTLSNMDVLRNSNHNLVLDDARNYLLNAKETYDIIAQQSSDPWQSFSTTLFSKEYYELVYRMLTDDGVYVTWVPVYTMSVEDFKSFYKTFSSVFPEVIAFANLKPNENIPFNAQAGELVFVGSKKKIDYVSKIEEQFDLLPPYAMQYLQVILIDSAEDMLNLFMFTNEDVPPKYAADAEVITDDNLKLEFSTAKRFLVRNPKEVLLDIENNIQNGEILIEE